MSTGYRQVDGMHMHTLEREALKQLARQAEERVGTPTIVNIGIAALYGHCSMRCLRAGSPNAVLIGIDIEDQGRVPAELNKERTVFIIGDSSTFLDIMPFTIDLAFVDGDHTESGVEKDALALFRLMRVGSYIAFHDYGHYGKKGFEHVWGVRRAVDRLFNGNRDWKHIRDVVSIRIFERVK